MTEDTKAIVGALDRLTTAIAAALGMFEQDAEPPEPVAVGCPHPEEHRKSFATSQDDDFYCQDCHTMIARPHALKG